MTHSTTLTLPSLYSSPGRDLPRTLYNRSPSGERSVSVLGCVESSVGKGRVPVFVDVGRRRVALALAGFLDREFGLLTTGVLRGKGGVSVR